MVIAMLLSISNLNLHFSSLSVYDLLYVAFWQRYVVYVELFLPQFCCVLPAARIPHQVQVSHGESYARMGD